MLRAKVIKAGEREPVDVTLTRQFAIRLFCDCYGHALSRKSWVFLLATDRDTLAMYVKRGDDPPGAPWQPVAHYGEHEIHVCGARLAIADEGQQVDVDADAIVSADDPGLVQQVAWWSSDTDRADTRRRRAQELESARAEYERKRREGLVDGTESDRPKDESPAAAARRRKAAREEAQPAFDLPSAGDDAPRDLDDRE